MNLFTSYGHIKKPNKIMILAWLCRFNDNGQVIDLINAFSMLPCLMIINIDKSVDMGVGILNTWENKRWILFSIEPI